ncbi:MAG: hypothetical protein AAGK21_02350 [Bacteroidota bacterium]
MTEPRPDASPDELPAFDRVQDTTNDGGRTVPSSKLRRSLIYAGLVAIGVLAVVWYLSPSDDTTDNLLVRLIQSASEIQPEVTTTDADEAHGFVMDQLGWSVPPPDFTGLALVGSAIAAIGSIQPSEAATPVDVEIPVFRYEGAAGERVHVYAYDYILLDRTRSVFDLPDAAYAVLSEPTPVDSRVVDGAYVVSWRQRAMIYSAVTNEEVVAEQIRQAVAL